MSNSLGKFAQDELVRVGMLPQDLVLDQDDLNHQMSSSLLDLIAMFSSQHHNGYSAQYAIDAFYRLATHRPLSPLTGEDDEWEALELGNHNMFQNTRYSSVFKQVNEDGAVHTYTVHGCIFVDPEGATFSRHAQTGPSSHMEITFPYTVPDAPEVVYVNDEDEVIDKATWTQLNQQYLARVVARSAGAVEAEGFPQTNDVRANDQDFEHHHDLEAGDVAASIIVKEIDLSRKH